MVGSANSENSGCFIESKEPPPATTMERRQEPSQVDTGHCANFGRGLKGWGAYVQAATSDVPHWFKDLLSLWRPSGVGTEDGGLRLAIRNGYLNFYRRGQSLARVECVAGKLTAKLHYKYVLQSASSRKDLYLNLTNDGIFGREGLLAPYQGVPTITQWAALVDDEYAGDEKAIVDELVAMNANVIDLEMALPAWLHCKVAVRMDLVAIEAGKVVFWEAKTVTDSRIRCRADYVEDLYPEVLKQLSRYRLFLDQNLHRDQVEKAYRETARLLVELRRLADAVGQAFPLGENIVAASQSNSLTVAPVAGLVVVGLNEQKDKHKRAWASWKETYEPKLSGKIPMRVLEQSGPLVFAGAR